MSVIINRVYTRAGDAGTTRLAGGQEVEKPSPRVEAYGTVDELNATLGLVAEEIRRSHGDDEVGTSLLRRVRRIQNELFDVGGELATLPSDLHPQQAIVNTDDVARLEQEIDELNEGLPTLRSFVLPGGGMVSAYMHLARTVCRRAERRLVDLHREEPLRGEVLQYVNRLSDWLFVSGRRSALSLGDEEVLWRPGNRE